MRSQTLLAAGAALALAAPAPALAQAGSPLGTLFSCDAPGSQHTAGAIIGGIAGAALGSQVSRNERTLGAVAGAALGAAAGNYIGCRMQQSSIQRAEVALERALNTGQPQTWRDPQTGAHGRIEVYQAPYAAAGYHGAPYAGQYSQNVAFQDLRFGPGITRVSAARIQPDTAMYQAGSRVNLRAGPTTSARVVGQLNPGETVSVAGRTSDNWLVVHQDGWVRGYVAGWVVHPVSGPQFAAGPPMAADCRTVHQTVNLRGYPQETHRFTACRDPYGQWRVQA